MKHGPIALIDEEVPVVSWRPRDHSVEKSFPTYRRLRAEGEILSR